jgi:hypothetical protein
MLTREILQSHSSLASSVVLELVIPALERCVYLFPTCEFNDFILVVGNWL